MQADITKNYCIYLIFIGCPATTKVTLFAKRPISWFNFPDTFRNFLDSSLAGKMPRLVSCPTIIKVDLHSFRDRRIDDIRDDLKKCKST